MSRDSPMAISADRASMKPENTRRARKAPSQYSDWAAVANMRAPKGARMAQMHTALEAAKPPRLHWSRKGSQRMRNSWLALKNLNRLVKKKKPRVRAETAE